MDNLNKKDLENMDNVQLRCRVGLIFLEASKMDKQTKKECIKELKLIEKYYRKNERLNNEYEKNN